MRLQLPGRQIEVGKEGFEGNCERLKELGKEHTGGAGGEGGGEPGEDGSRGTFTKLGLCVSPPGPLPEPAEAEK